MSRYGRATSYAGCGPETTNVSFPALMTFALPLTGAARYWMPLSCSIERSSAEPSSEMEEHSMTIFGFFEPATSFCITSFTSSHVDTMQNTMSREARCHLVTHAPGADPAELHVLNRGWQSGVPLRDRAK